MDIISELRAQAEQVEVIEIQKESNEIGFEASEAFRHAGGEQLYRCPCLNDHPAWIEAMKTLLVQEGQGWL